jgi:hypothetical protein
MSLFWPATFILNGSVLPNSSRGAKMLLRCHHKTRVLPILTRVLSEASHCLVQAVRRFMCYAPQQIGALKVAGCSHWSAAKISLQPDCQQLRLCHEI